MKILHLLCSGVLFSNCVISFPVQAQITIDGTTNTVLDSNGKSITIDEGDRLEGNLFHSFEQFSIPNGSEAFFNNANDIVNIFSRVTGGDISNIDGLIRANGDANLFLINPAGIVFGEGASLNIGGSFFASTAESIVFGDDLEFSSATDTANEPLLTINQPIGLNIGNNPGDIAVNGSNLQVNSGETLALLGGKLALKNASLSTLGGRVELAAISDADKIILGSVSETTSEHSFLFPNNFQGATIDLSNNSTIFVVADDSGSIALNGSQINLSEGSNLQAGIVQDGGTAESQAGDIIVNATETVTIDGVANGSLSGIFNQVGTNAIGNAGNIAIDANNVKVINGGQLNTSTSGTGNAGTIRINATNKVLFDRSPEGFLSSALSQVGVDGVGNSGGIEINAGTVEVTNGGYLEANTLGTGNAGKIQINAADSVIIDGQSASGFLSALFSQVGADANGNSGGIEINAGNVAITNGGQLSANTLGTGDAGLIKMAAEEQVIFDGESSSNSLSSAFSQVRENAVGNSAGIEINAGNVAITNGAQLSATTLSQGNSGLIKITGNDRVVLDGEAAFSSSAVISQVFTGAEGNSAGIEIQGNIVEITNGAQLTATTLGRGNSGLIKITGTEEIIFDGESTGGRTFSSAISQVFTEAAGNSGGIELNGGTVSITNGAFIDASTLGEGDAGAIEIDGSDRVVVNGESSTGSASFVASIVGADAVGNSKGISVNTVNLFLQNGGRLTTLTLGQGNAGTINIEALDTITADGSTQNEMFPSGILSTVLEGAIGNSGQIDLKTTNLSLSNGSQINASTSGEGNAGAIEIEASDTITADGSTQNEMLPSGIFSTVEESGVGNANNISIETNNLSLTNDAVISVESIGQGAAGNLDIEANSVNLRNDAALFASTSVGTGGNITLQISEELILQNNSTISAQALESADGGNLTLDAATIVAFPNQNNDIIANAGRGDGGNIDLTTNAIFGLAERSSTPTNLTNDIDASSEFGLDGTVSINELEVNPAEGLEELPAEIIDVARLVAQNLCQQGRGSEFIVTGKGGIAPSPSQTRDGNVGLVGLVEPVVVEKVEEVDKEEKVEEAKEEIVEAQGWIVNDQGTLELVAHQTNLNSHPQSENSRICY